jgi:hypothetical protein
MKLFINHLDEKNIRENLKEYECVDFSLFVDDVPKTQYDLSEINICVLQEPNEYFGLHDWVINNKDLFQVILTWSDKIINNCDNALHFSFGNTWINEKQSTKVRNKKFEISHLCGKLLKTYGQSLRHEILTRKNEFNIPTNFYDVYGDRNNIEDARLGKEFIFGDSQFGVVIENTSHRGYFTEKIMDCFLLKTIPLYWGCSNIGDYFDIEGIIPFNNIDDLIYISNNLTEDFYESKKEIIDKNWLIAKNYVNYEIRITDFIKDLFKINKII